jgi:hypothetical protein
MNEPTTESHGRANESGSLVRCAHPYVSCASSKRRERVGAWRV